MSRSYGADDARIFGVWRVEGLISLSQSKTPFYSGGAEGRFGGCKSLTMTYFHTGTRTIIGAKSFHCPVRDGKEWDQLAMVIRHNWLLSCSGEQHNEFIESGISWCVLTASNLA